VPLGLLAYERGRGGGGRGMLAWAAAAGLFASWLQPWQGVELAAIVLVAEAIQTRRERRPAGLAANDLLGVLAATAAPLVYYLWLSHSDPSWKLANRVNDFGRWPWWVTVLGLLPLALPALLAYRRRPRDFGETALRLWPLAALAVFYQPAGTFPFHAFQGLTLPLSVLAVLGVRAHLRRERPRRAASIAVLAAVALLIVPGTIHLAKDMRDAVHSGRQAHYLTTGERDALRYLDGVHESGGVLAPLYSGVAVPAYTGRETWVGPGSWTPSAGLRREYAERLFAGRLSPADAQSIVAISRARFLLSDCHTRADIARVVARFTDPPRRFGCATVWRVRLPNERRPPA
jgi:MFS family permease